MTKAVTPHEALIRSQYVGLIEKWNRVQVKKLANLINRTDRELAAMINMSYTDFKRGIKNNKFKGEVALHFENIENAVIKEALK